MARQRKREPILPQGRIDRARRRLRSLRREGSRTGGEGPFLRRAWRERRLGVHRALATLLLVWALCALVAGDHGVMRIRALERDRDQLRSEIVALEEQVEDVRSHLSDAPAQDYLVEKTAREAYGLCRSGEIVYRFDAASLGAPSAKGPLAGVVGMDHTVQSP